MLSILYEDDSLLAVNKPTGLRTEGDPGMEAEVARYLKENYPWKKQLIVGIAHRLDRPVSGALLFAIKRAALKDLGKQFADRSVQKIYLALVESAPPAASGELSHWLLKDVANKRALIFDKAVVNAKPARLKYRLLKEQEEFFLLEIELLTGRYHQIRAQLAAAGVPIVGDKKYGSNYSFSDERICLHAHRLVVRHPGTGLALELTAPLPQTDWQPGDNLTPTDSK